MIVSEGELIWPAINSGLSELTNISPTEIALAESLAVEWLWALTARRLGTRIVQDRPQTVRSPYLFRSIPSYLQSVNGYSRGWPYDTDPRTGQSSQRQILLLLQDALSVNEIVMWLAPNLATDPAIDPSTGVLDPTVYRLEGNYLIRQDGGIWPQTQNSIAALGRPDTWQISYERGIVPPIQGQRAAGLLALEFGKAIIGKTVCKLPANAQTVARSGVTINLDVLAVVRTTGVAEVDKWVSTMNPNALMTTPKVWNPDVPRNGGPYLGSYAGGTSTVLP